ncbi:MAG: hypothetical protein KAT15_19870, partial [Bacteroidales bacterium]|nr:hypothetical protein [Bacteroidales bacterium]
MEEHSLDRRSLTLVLSEETFQDYTALVAGNFSLVNAPSGLVIDSVTGISSTEARLDLGFTYQDFDIDYNDFRVFIRGDVLIQSAGDDLISNNAIPIIAFIETPQAFMAPDLPLNETNLDGRTLTLNLVEEEFIDYLTLSTGNFSLAYAPSGLSINSVTGSSPTEAQLTLRYTGIDFDDNINNFAVNISPFALVQTSAENLVSSQQTITAVVEVPDATLVSDDVLNEYGLDDRVLSISLFDEEFIEFNTLQVSNFTLVNGPAGLTIENVQGIDPQNADIYLAHDGTDYDSDIDSFYVTLTSDRLIQTETGSLATSRLDIYAYDESPAATLTEDAVLAEYTLDERYLTVDLFEEWFNDYTLLNSTDFTLVNAPAGLAIESAIGISDTSARIDLQFDETDFDNNIPNFHIEIPADLLFQTPSGVLASGNLTIHAFEENPVATLVSDTILREQTLDDRSLTITLTEEQFNDYTTISIAHFGLLNAPAGLDIE